MSILRPGRLHSVAVTMISVNAGHSSTSGCPALAVTGPGSESGTVTVPPDWHPSRTRPLAAPAARASSAWAPPPRPKQPGTAGRASGYGAGGKLNLTQRAARR